MTNCLISIIMPAYNAQHFIAEAIDSVIGQTYGTWELLIINDGSTDATGEIINNYCSHDERIKAVHQSNKKLGAARNAGIVNASGQWIAFLDADDLWHPQKLHRQLHLAAAKPDVGLIFTDGTIFYTNTETTAPYDTLYGQFEGVEMYKLLYTGNYIPVLSVLVKTTLVKAVGLQDESPNLYGCEDWDYWLRFCLSGVVFYGMEDKLFRYRRHLANMSNNEALMRYARANVFLKNLRNDLLNSREKNNVKSFIDITICQFVKTGKITEATLLSKKMAELFTSPLRQLGKIMISTFRQQSYYMLRVAFKLDKLLYNA